MYMSVTLSKCVLPAQHGVVPALNIYISLTFIFPTAEHDGGGSIT